MLYLVPEAVQHVEQLEEVDQDHGVGGGVQALLLHLCHGHGQVDQTLDNQGHREHAYIYINNKKPSEVYCCSRNKLLIVSGFQIQRWIDIWP